MYSDLDAMKGDKEMSGRTIEQIKTEIRDAEKRARELKKELNSSSSKQKNYKTLWLVTPQAISIKDAVVEVNEIWRKENKVRLEYKSNRNYRYTVHKDKLFSSREEALQELKKYVKSQITYHENQRGYELSKYRWILSELGEKLEES